MVLYDDVVQMLGLAQLNRHTGVGNDTSDRRGVGVQTSLSITHNLVKRTNRIHANKKTDEREEGIDGQNPGFRERVD